MDRRTLLKACATTAAVGASAPAASAQSTAAFRSAAPSRVDFVFHPTFQVTDRAEWATWMKRVFGRWSTYEEHITQDLRMEYPEAAMNKPKYGIYTWIADVWFWVHQPDRLGFLKLSPSEHYLSELSFYTNDMPRLLAAFASEGVRNANTGQVFTTTPPISIFGEGLVLVTADARDVGFRTAYRYFAPRKARAAAEVFYPRLMPNYDWKPWGVLSGDPLGIARCSHYTILTDNPARAIHHFAGVLGGRVIHHGENPLLSSRSTYVYVGDALIELATPLGGDGPAATALREKLGKRLEERPGQPKVAAIGDDVFYSVCFAVQNLNRTVAHLRDQGVRLEGQTETTVITNPADCLGMRWGFTSIPIPNDPRALV